MAHGPSSGAAGPARPGAARARPVGAEPPDRGGVDLAVLLDLLGAACTAGATVPGALAAVGRAVGGDRGRFLVEGSVALAVGAPWASAWSASPELAAALEVLRPSWEEGVAPTVALRAGADALRRERHARALEAAARLGVRLVLPLALCYLPAFVLVGLVPVLVSMATGALG